MESSTANRLRSIKLWPPSHKTRRLLVERIVKSLTTLSFLSRKYGLVKKEEAEEQAKQIESSAFQTANQHFEKESDGDGESDVQVYAKESSTLMVEAVKKGPSLKADEAKELLKPLTEHGNWKRISKKRTKNQAKTDKTEHGNGKA
ncbi:leucine-rich repeat, ribonuclease inhibitor subtype protein [Tanacetum coccineum]